MTDKFVKKCCCCQTLFTARQLVDDPTIRPIGTVFLEDAGTGAHYYLFQHEIPDCGTSFVVNVEHFKRFITEPIPEDVLRLGPDCEGHCVNIHDLSDCGQECHFAPFRRFLLKMLAEKNGSIQRASGAAI